MEVAEFNADLVKEYYDNFTATEEQPFPIVNLKEVPIEKKAEIIKMALHYDNLEDPMMLLNILNLIKVYNTLDDSYFESKDIYVNSVEELLDLKLALSKELKDFSRQLSIYFLSLLKSYNKLAYTPADEHIELPKIYSNIIKGSDLLTLSGIFAKVSKISTDDLIYIDNAFIYVTELISRSAIGGFLLDEFLQVKEEESK